MSYRTQANKDNNATAGLVVSDSITNGTNIVTGLRLTNAQPVHVAVVDSSGSQVIPTGRNVQTPNAPTKATIGVTSAQALASNSSRTGLVMVNTSGTNNISLGFGANAAVLNNGITLIPGAVWVMDAFTFTTQAIMAIAAGASTNLSIQEFT